MSVAPPVLSIAARPPFSFDLALAYFQRRAGELVDAVEGDVYRRLLIQDGAPVLVEARAEGDIEKPLLRLKLLAGKEGSIGFAAGALRRSFGLDDDLESFQFAVAADRVLSGLLRRYRGLRLIRTQSAFEALVWAVIGQQINLTFAFRLKSALVREYGSSFAFGGRTSWAFPAPERLAQANAVVLAATGLGQRKAATIVNIARAVAGGELDLERLTDLKREEAMGRLIALPGIGPWTAAYTLLRGLGDFGACPVSDLGLRAAVGRLYGDGTTASEKEVAALADGWGEWRGYAAFYLWNALAARAA